MGCVALHGIAGAKIIWQTWFGNAVTTRRKRGNVSSQVATASGTVAPVLLGIFALSKEPLMVFPSTIARFAAVFQQSWLYRI